MNERLNKREGLSYRCPVCDVTLAAEPVLPMYDTPCPNCGYRLWCRKKKVGDVVVLSVLPDGTPEVAEIERLVESLVGSCRMLRVVVDLSGLEFINSAMMARLISLRKRVLAAKGKLVLCGLSPHVQTVFSRTRIETLFEIVDTATDAVRTLSSEARHRQVPATRIQASQPAINAAGGNRPLPSQPGIRKIEMRFGGGHGFCSV